MDILNDEQAAFQTRKRRLGFKVNLKRETETLVIATQNNATGTNNIKTRTHKTQKNSICRLCGDRHEMIKHIIRECSKLT